MKYLTILIILLSSFTLSSCMATRAVGGAAKMTAKAGWAVTKTTGKALYSTGKYTSRGVKHLLGRYRIKLRKEGNAYYVPVVINGRHKTELLLDTGATAIQLPMDLAKQIGAHRGKTQEVIVTIADGSKVQGRAFQIPSVKIGGAAAKHVDAVVVKGNKATGLLGMSFLGRF
ncbi:MAG: retroviral-like aspartic protease family protein, partial [Planctomycetes bacterium]|nr:retroviral-like aspartic protease family protein [Planctomycetota bacterium]